MQKQKPPKIIEDDNQEINLNTIEFNPEFKTLDDLKANFGNITNNSNILEINTDINQIDQFDE